MKLVCPNLYVLLGLLRFLVCNRKGKEVLAAAVHVLYHLERQRFGRIVPFSITRSPSNGGRKHQLMPLSTRLVHQLQGPRLSISSVEVCNGDCAYIGIQVCGCGNRDSNAVVVGARQYRLL
jgi:hypothetical protein